MKLIYYFTPCGLIFHQNPPIKHFISTDIIAPVIIKNNKVHDLLYNSFIADHITVWKSIAPSLYVVDDLNTTIYINVQDIAKIPELINNMLSNYDVYINDGSKVTFNRGEIYNVQNKEHKILNMVNYLISIEQNPYHYFDNVI